MDIDTHAKLVEQAVSAALREQREGIAEMVQEMFDKESFLLSDVIDRILTYGQEGGE